MKPSLLLLQVALAVLGLAGYHLARPAPAASAPRAVPGRVPEPGGAAESPAGPVPALEQRARELDASARRIAALEARLYELRQDLADVRLVAASGSTRESLLSDARLEALERKVEVVEQRQLVDRRTHNLQIAIRELHQGFNPVQERMIVDLLQRAYAEGGAFAKKLRDENVRDPQKDLEGHDAIRKRYHQALRELLTTEQAEAVIERFLPLR